MPLCHLSITDNFAIFFFVKMKLVSTVWVSTSLSKFGYREPSPNVIALKENNNNNYKPQVQIDFKIENGDGSTVASQKLPTPTISYEWSDSSPSNEFSPSYLPRMGKNNFNFNILIFTFLAIWHKLPWQEGFRHKFKTHNTYLLRKE